MNQQNKLMKIMIISMMISNHNFNNKFNLIKQHMDLNSNI